jgi:hypothetical protein
VKNFLFVCWLVGWLLQWLLSNPTHHSILDNQTSFSAAAPLCFSREKRTNPCSGSGIVEPQKFCTENFF